MRHRDRERDRERQRNRAKDTESKRARETGRKRKRKGATASVEMSEVTRIVICEYKSMQVLHGQQRPALRVLEMSVCDRMGRGYTKYISRDD